MLRYESFMVEYLPVMAMVSGGVLAAGMAHERREGYLLLALSRVRHVQPQPADDRLGKLLLLEKRRQGVDAFPCRDC